MGKNKLNSKNRGNSKNPIYKKVGAGAPLKTKSKAKQVKTNLKRLKIANKEAVASLDKKLGAFHKAVQNNKQKKPKHTATVHDEKPPVNMEEAAESLSKL